MAQITSHCFVFFSVIVLRSSALVGYIHATSHTKGIGCTRAACPEVSSSDISPSSGNFCPGDVLTLSVEGVLFTPGDSIHWYISPETGFNPYADEGEYICSTPISSPFICAEILYIMVNPDDSLVGSSSDCNDEFIVLYTGSIVQLLPEESSYTISDIQLSALDIPCGYYVPFLDLTFVPGNVSTFSCGTPIGPDDPIPVNAILVIQTNTTNNIPVDLGDICYSGLPVYITAIDAPADCAGGLFPNSQYELTPNYGGCGPPYISTNFLCGYNWGPDGFGDAGGPILAGMYVNLPDYATEGWGYSNSILGGGYGPTVPQIEIPEVDLQFSSGYWTIPFNFCEDHDPGTYYITGVLDHVPPAGCPEIFTSEFEISIVCLNEVYGIPNSMCESDPVVSLPSVQSGITGSWSGSGVISNAFNPSGLSGPIVLTFLPDAAGCTIDTVIIVNPSTLISIYLPDTLCSSASPLLLSTNINGITGTWSGPGVINNAFNPAGQSGTVALTFTPAIGQCADQFTHQIAVAQYQEPAIAYVPSVICNDDTPVYLSAIQDGVTGNWSGPGVANNIFDPAGQSGIVTLSFIPDPGQCADIAIVEILVEPDIVPVISGVPETTCQEHPIILPTILEGVSGNWSGPGVVNNIFDPAEQSGMVTLSFIPAQGQCADIAVAEIHIEPGIIPVISGVPDALCQVDAPVILPALLGGVSGSWSGTGVSSNSFNPAGLSGIVELTFTPDTQSCAETATTIIIVSPLLIPAISGIPNSICQLEPVLVLPAPHDGISGSWSGTGVMNNTFHPDTLSGLIILSFVPDSGQCVGVAQHGINVQRPFIPAITGIHSGICAASPPLVLPALLNGITGNWSGDGVVLNIFDPTGLYGPIELTFTPDTGQCALKANTIITVGDIFIPEITGIPFALCQTSEPIVLPITQDGVTGNWSGPGVTNNIFDPSGQSGILQLFFSPLSDPCVDKGMFMISVNSSPGFTYLNATCDSSSQTYIVSFDILGGNPSGYTVNGIPVVGSRFTSLPIPAEITQYTFVLDDMNACGQVLVTGSVNCACATSAGTMYQSATPLHICEGTIVMAQHNADARLDPDDLLAFVLHDQSGTQLGTVYASGSTPVFNSPPGINLGQTYYLSAIAGSNNGTGNIDLSDECLSVSQGTPVIFYRPDIAISPGTDLCSSDCMTYALQLTGEGIIEFSYHILANDEPHHQTLSGAAGSLSLSICPSDYSLTSGTLDLIPIQITDANCSIALTPSPGTTSTVFSTSTAELSPRLCPGESITVNGTMYDQFNLSGIERIAGGNAFGCDSVIRINLTYYEPAIAQVAQTLCFGSSLQINGSEYNVQNPQGNEILPGASSHGCDSIIHVDLTFDSLVSGEFVASICVDEVININGTTYGSSHPTGTEFFPNGSTSGCDSILYVSLSFYPESVSVLSSALCTGDLIVVNGAIYDESNPSGVEVLQDANVYGCDSVINIKLIFYPESYTYINDTLVAGERIIVNGNIYDQQNPEGTEIISGGSAAGCDSVIEIALHFVPALTLLVQAIPPACHGEITGAIVVEEILGGKLPYKISLDGLNTFSVSVFPVTLTGLSAGVHLLRVQDRDLNTLSVEIEVTDAPILTVFAGMDVTMAEGENARLRAEANFEVVSWSWSPQDFLSCVDCPDPLVVRPNRDMHYSLTATDASGCVATDDLMILVESAFDFFAPNSFTPNGDNVNDTWMVFTNRTDARLRQLVIYDRWGEVLFRKTDFHPNDPDAGWDGTYRGKALNPGVYVFRSILELEDGQRKEFTGSLTLLR